MATNFLFVLHHWIIFSQIIIFANSNDITCSADGLCRGKPIICNENEECSIKCDGKDSCWYSIIQCPIRNKCNVWCGLDRNTCDAITINATHSTALYMYCADNECDDTTIYCPTKHYIGIDHQCTLEGAKTLDRVLFYTMEGFHDINIANIPLTASMIVCGDRGQYRCAINADETGCVLTNDNTCETYRLPTSAPSAPPSTAPTISPTATPSSPPTAIQTVSPSTETPTDAPTTAPVQMYDTQESRLEFYVYYNDPNGVNMILAKWMREELLNTYDEHTGTSHDYNKREYNENRKWRMGGIVNMTFCVVFNTYYGANGNSNTCQRFKEYELDLNDPSQFNTQYVAYGTFGIIADQSIDTFRLFVIDSMTSILFRQTFNANMAQRLKSVGFDYIFQAAAIKVQPLTQTRSSIANVNHVDHENSINIALGVLLGILAALTCIVVVYCAHHYAFKSFKKAAKPVTKSKKTREGRATAMRGHTAAAEQMNLKIVPRNSTTATGTSLYDHGLLPTKRCSTTSTGTHLTLRKNTRIDQMMEEEEDPFQKDDKCIARGYYLSELQKTYLSTDDTNTEDEEQNDEIHEKLPRIPLSSPPSDSNDKSIISSIISFGKRNKNKHKKSEKEPKHKRSQTVEINKKHKKKRPKRKRSLHWGFTDGGDDIRYVRGEHGYVTRPSRGVSVDTTPSTHSMYRAVPRHSKCQSMYNGQLRTDALPDIKSLELARKSSYHSFVNNHHSFPVPVSYQHAYIHQFRSPQVMQHHHHLRIPPVALQRTFSLNGGYSDHKLNNEQFLEQLSPSMKSIEEMYASPKSTDGPSNWTGGRQSTASATTTNIMLQKTASPPANQSTSQTLNLEAQHKINEVSHSMQVVENSVNHVVNDSQITVIMTEDDDQCV